MAKYPDIRSRRDPGADVVQREHGWCSPTAIEQAACVMRLTPALPDRRRDASTTCSRPTPVGRARRLRVHEHLVLAAAAPTSSTRAMLEDGRRRPATSTCAASSASARATSRRWRRSTASTSGRSSSATSRAHRRATARPGSEVLPDKQLQPPQGRLDHWREPLIDDIDTVLFKDIDEPGLNTLDVYRAPRRLRDAAQGAADGAATRRARRDATPPACAAAAAPASRWARRCPSSPRATMDKYLVCNADESEPGHVQGPRADAEEPAHADRGHHHRAPTRSARTSAFIYIRGEYDQQADILDAARRRGARGRLPRREHPRLRPHARRSSCTAAPAPTSAARRRRCSTRSRASAATRA